MRRSHSAACVAAMHACFLRAALVCAVPAATVLVITFVHRRYGTPPDKVQHYAWAILGRLAGAAEKKMKRNLRASQTGAKSLPVACVKDIVGSLEPDGLVRGEP